MSKLSNNFGNCNNSYNGYNYNRNVQYRYAPRWQGKKPPIKIMVVLSCMIVFFACACLNTSNQNAVRQDEQSLMETQNEMIEYKRAYSKEDIVDILSEMIENNVEDYNIQVESSVTEDEIFSVDEEIDLFLGRVTGILSMHDGKYDDHVSGSYTDVNFTFERSIESYVYNDITKGIPIPNENVEALKVKNECENFLRDHIKPEMSDYDKEVAVHDYIVNNCRYNEDDVDEGDVDVNEVNDPHSYKFNSYGVLINKEAVCEGYARTTALLLKLSGVQVDLIEGKGKGQDQRGHMWDQVCIDGVWYHYDATWDDPIDERQKISHLYLNLSDEILSLDHEWDKDKYHSCDCMDENYFNKSGQYFTDNASFQQYVKEQLMAGERDCIICVVSSLDLSEETLGFIFDYDGIGSYWLRTSGYPEYQYLEIHIN